jgi:hypothetical protein
MPDIDDLEVIRELLTGKLPSQDVNDYVKGRLNAVMAAAESHPGAGRPVRRTPRSRRTVAGVAWQQRRRLALRSVAGVAAALAAGAVALVAVGVPGARHNGTGGPAVLAAYVVKRVDSALSAADDIAQMTVATSSAAISGGPAVTATAEEWSNGEQWRAVMNSPAGHPVYDEGSSTSSVYTLVSYPTRTWARQPGLGRPAAPVSGPGSCEPVVPGPGRPVPVLFQPGLPGTNFSASSPPATVARDLRTAVSCGTLAMAGRQRVHGIEAIELTSRPDSMISETIWVSPGTYLPVRVVVRSAPGQPVVRLTADITWLPPTAQTLARLTVLIPARFRQVPLTEAVQPILQQIPGGLLPKPKAPCPAPAGPACKDRTVPSGSGP